MSPRLKFPVLVALLAALCGACGDDSSEGPTLGADASSTGSNADAGTCLVRCQAVAKKCESPSNMCTDMCKSVTEAQLACVEASPCNMTAIQQCFLSSDAGTNDASSDVVTDTTQDTGSDAVTAD